MVNFRLHVLDDPSTAPSTSYAVKLVSATHALSNYSLSITPGVAITPAQIRMNRDPALLVSKVIENNPPVYKEGDRMIKILDDLIDGTLLFANTPGTRELDTSRMQARVNAAIVNAALAENDYSTAYETCVNKLSPLTLKYPEDAAISGAAWLAFYRTGIHTGPPTRGFTGRSLSPNTALDFQKMELLARAILICPKEEIEGILKRWTELENKVHNPEIALPPASAQSSGEHRGFLETAAQVGRSVARTATPLISGTGSRNGGVDAGREMTSGDFGSWGASTSRFGVRDTVKTGLTQGIGWLLGAAPEHDNNNNGGDYR